MNNPIYENAKQVLIDGLEVNVVNGKNNAATTNNNVDNSKPLIVESNV